MSELPLVFLVFLSQLGIGIFIISQLGVKIDDKVLRLKFAVFALILMASAGLASIGHLSNPKNLLLVLSNIGTSWLSREILFIGVTTGLMTLVCFMQLRRQTNQIIEVICGLSGLLTIFSTSMVYMLPGQPAWDHFSHIFGAFAFAVIGGVLITRTFVDLTQDEIKKLTRLVTVILVLEIGSIAGYVQYLTTTSPEYISFLMNDNIAAVSWILSLVVSVWLILNQKTNQQFRVAVPLAIVYLGSEFILKSVFYDMVISNLPVF